MASGCADKTSRSSEITGALEQCAMQKTMSQNPDKGSRQAAVEGLMPRMEGVSAAGPVRCCQHIPLYRIVNKYGKVYYRDLKEV